MDPVADDHTAGSDRHDPIDPDLSVDDPDQSTRDEDDPAGQEKVSDAMHGRNVRRAAAPFATAPWRSCRVVVAQPTPVRKIPVPTLGAVSSRRPVVLGARCPMQLYAVLGFVRHSGDSNPHRPPLTEPPGSGSRWRHALSTAPTDFRSALQVRVPVRLLDLGVELSGVPANHVERFRTALTGPLPAIGTYFMRIRAQNAYGTSPPTNEVRLVVR